MKRFRIFPVIYVLLVSCILLSIIWAQQTLLSYTPINTTYTYVSGHMGDYYAYTYMIQRGREGHLLFHTAYSNETVPDALNQPFYHVIGLLSRPFGVSPFIVFYIARVVSVGLFFVMIYFVIERMITSDIVRVLAGVLVTSSTAVWTFVEGQVHTRINWIDYFDIYNKYQHIPPHHYLALACFMGILLILTAPSLSLKKSIAACVLAGIIGVLQPYTSFFTSVVLAIACCFQYMGSRRITKYMQLSIVVIGISLAMMAMSAYVLQMVIHAPFAATSVFWGQPRAVPLVDYIYSLGPLVLFAFWVVLNPSMRALPMTMYLSLWAGIPIVLYLLPMIGNVTSEYRLFQTYQHVPLAILAAMSFQYIVKNYLHISLRVVTFFICVSSLLYGGAHYYFVAKSAVSRQYTNYFNIYIPDYLTEVFQFLKTSTPQDSVVLAGPVVSSMIPVFTNNKVIIGHESTTRNYDQKKADADNFYSGSLSNEQITAYLKKNHITYILFGVDAPTAVGTGYLGSPSLRQVYANGDIRIMQALE